jgi:hypothetical protein
MGAAAFDSLREVAGVPAGHKRVPSLDRIVPLGGSPALVGFQDAMPTTMD